MQAEKVAKSILDIAGRIFHILLFVNNRTHFRYVRGGSSMRQAIEVTDKAIKELQGMDLAEQAFMRIGVMPGGCSGMTYSASIDTELDAEDVVLYDKEGIRVVTASSSVGLLDGLTIDYSDDLIRSGFRFKNPNACGSCGCGSSFGSK
jgi:iron-sulfur cluster assembly protein